MHSARVPVSRRGAELRDRTRLQKHIQHPRRTPKRRECPRKQDMGRSTPTRRYDGTDGTLERRDGSAALSEDRGRAGCVEVRSPISTTVLPLRPSRLLQPRKSKNQRELDIAGCLLGPYLGSRYLKHRTAKHGGSVSIRQAPAWYRRELLHSASFSTHTGLQCAMARFITC